MSLVFHQYPVNSTLKLPVITNWNPLIGYMLFQNASIAALFYYKLVLEIRTQDATGTLLGIIRQRRNGYSDDIANNKARAFFDVRDIVNTQLVDTQYDQNCDGVPFEPIHKVGASAGFLDKIFSKNGNAQQGKTQLVKIFVKGYENYSSSADQSPQDQTGGAVTTSHYYLQGTLPLFTKRSFISTSSTYDTDYIQGDAFKSFVFTGSTSRFLSDVEKFTDSTASSNAQYINYIQSNDYHTLAFINGVTDFASESYTFLIQYYDSSGSQIGSNQFLTNTNANGGANPSTEVSTDDERLIYLGCGTANLEAQTVNTSARPSAFSNYAYYRITGLDSLGVTHSATYYFVKQDLSCKGFKTRRLAFRNSLGCYDYFNFTKKSTQTVDVSRDTYGSLIGTYNKSKWRYDDYQRGSTVRQTTAKLKETLNTDWIREEQATLIEKLLMSTDVYVIENADTEFTQAVMVTSSSHIRKTQANDGMKIQYSIDIEYANNLNTNS
jgi:hypothetical protein